MLNCQQWQILLTRLVHSYFTTPESYGMENSKPNLQRIVNTNVQVKVFLLVNGHRNRASIWLQINILVSRRILSSHLLNVLIGKCDCCSSSCDHRNDKGDYSVTLNAGAPGGLSAGEKLTLIPYFYLYYLGTIHTKQSNNTRSTIS